MKRALGIALLALAALTLGAAAGVITVGHFSAGDLAGWEAKEFKGLTSYSLVETHGRTVLKAVSQSSASALIKNIEADPANTPMLSWSWKIEKTLPGGDGRTKAGDDFAARVYVVFPSFLFWNTRALNYVWANKLPVGHTWPNAFAGDNVMMMAINSGDGQAGQWVSHRRNLAADFRRCFGEEPPAIGAIAVMTDSDNTKGHAIAYYGDITLGPR
ncbi:MAG: DUF3047 domain-containing protein [Desulfarculaceae bacterium]|nr:DUF3047 domain-containing protein [Desulfarculaceae bacterium]MCF8048352.1 DUF3047 domain-containing protein [Desulfarculaceae bacterium]MCF8064558.1 DUF3047 domain-containing protein [Desulfarculaceae bacterium]MCF8099274.1 DUF3047 domain-containing protein [Desulfarculaceae bacterium]MCF8123289.1 DUF3047 domain-containing protein [Desulfarculaceae bacterium]